MGNEQKVVRGKGRIVGPSNGEVLANPRRALSILEIFALDQMVDLDGRPLRELSANNQLVKQQQKRGVRFNKTQYTRNDSPTRHPDGKPHKNPYLSSPLEQIHKGENYKRVVGGMNYLRSFFTQGQDRPLSVQELFQLSIMATAVAPYLVARKESTIKRDKIPVPAALLYKTMAGITKNCMRIFNQNNANPFKVRDEQDFRTINIDRDIQDALTSQQALYMTPQEFYQTAEVNHSLVGLQYVCAAPASMIEHVAAAGINGTEVENQHMDYWQELIPDLPSLYGFGIVNHKFECLSQAYDMFLARGITQESLASFTGTIAEQKAIDQSINTFTAIHIGHITKLSAPANEFLGRETTNMPPITPVQVEKFYLGG